MVKIFSGRFSYPPTINTYWRRTGTRIYIAKRGVVYRKEVVQLVRAERRAAEPLEGRLAVIIRLAPPDKRRRDIDNIIKPLVDALQHARLFVDDEQIDFLAVRRLPMDKPGWVEVDVHE